MITGKAVIGPKKMVVMAKDVSVIIDPNISFGATLAGSRSSLAESARHYPLSTVASALIKYVFCGPVLAPSEEEAELESQSSSSENRGSLRAE